ncbi:MAG: phosphatidylglycerophosphatase A [Pirellulales bacterium]|nr:phosphatidylglycerophosphatase A [Pirellulales bacterium]
MTKDLPIEIRLSQVARQGGWVLWLASGSYFGFAPFASGTFGALWGLPLAWAIAMLQGLPLQGAVIVALCLAGIPLSSAAARRLGGLKDPGYVVFDEIVSMPITFLAIPFERWEVIAAGFLLNRVFDIVKPPPARQLERLPDGLGIMSDDWIAGIYSNLALHLLLWSGVLPRLFGA